VDSSCAVVPSLPFLGSAAALARLLPKHASALLRAVFDAQLRAGHRVPFAIVPEIARVVEALRLTLFALAGAERPGAGEDDAAVGSDAYADAAARREPTFIRVWVAFFAWRARDPLVAARRGGASPLLRARVAGDL
jgi:hypothetical protein